MAGQADDGGGVRPDKIWKYHLKEPLGRGSCGMVYKGYDPFVKRDVAIKIATPSVEALTSDTLDSTTMQAGDDFFTEARAAGMLHHPHIVALYDAGIQDRLKFLVMEYIDGETLKPACKREAERLPVERAVDIAFKCAKALDYAHGKGVLHRDIKPGNIMVTGEGVPKIMDFSIAEIGSAPDTSRAGLAGSPLYMAPEQVRGEPVGPTSDLHALGAVLFHLLTGEPPFVAKDREALFAAIKDQRARRVDEVRPGLPRQVGDIVARMLEKNPADRYQTGNEVATDLARLFEQLQEAGKKISKREGQESLRQVGFFDAFSDAELDEILAAGTLARFEPDETIIREAEIDSAFYVLVEGIAEVRKGDRTVSRLAAGDCFGEMGFLTASLRTASVVANTPVVAIRVTSKLMDGVSRDCQLRFYKVFTETLVARLTQTTQKLTLKGAT